MSDSEIALAWARSQLMIKRMEKHFTKEEMRQFLEDNAIAATASFQGRVYLTDHFTGEGWYVCKTFVPRGEDELKKFIRMSGDCPHTRYDQYGNCVMCDALVGGESIG